MSFAEITPHNLNTYNPISDSREWTEAHSFSVVRRDVDCLFRDDRDVALQVALEPWTWYHLDIKTAILCIPSGNL